MCPLAGFIRPFPDLFWNRSIFLFTFETPVKSKKPCLTQENIA